MVIPAHADTQFLELLGFTFGCFLCQFFRNEAIYYLIILDTTQAPTVFPPSRIANLSLSSIATGPISLTINFIVSPGITISIPWGNVTSPVTSVVLM